jgi:ElaB/YqjD/DUF883 family membrane-anchored ribosome-binding protein
MAETSSDIVNNDRAIQAGSRPEVSYEHTPRPFNPAPQDETQQIRAEIEVTRAEMGSTIDAIQEKLSPHHVIEEVKKSVREATIGKAKEIMQNVGDKVSEVTDNVADVTKDAGASAVRLVRENPVPFALIGSGIGLLIVNQFRNASNGENGVNVQSSNLGEVSTPPSPGIMDKAQTAVGDAVSKVQDTASDIADKTRTQVSQLSTQVQKGAREAGHQFRQNLRERPLVVGAVAMAVGALVALSIPTTEVEQEYMGEARDKLFDKAEDVAKDAIKKVETKVTEATQDRPPQNQPAQGTAAYR